MRAIKFRQWSGDRFFTWGLLDDGFGMHFKSPSSGNKFNPTNSEHEQFTGLLDKNGVEIYEGDIIECWGVNLKIVWDESDASFFADSPNSNIYESGQEWGSNCVVIGNIHEAPELLK